MTPAPVQVLEREGFVRVELAPREPRTWPKIDEEPDELPRLVHVENHGQWTLKYGIYISVGNLYDEAYNLLQLRMLGHVTEVSDEPGGEQR